MNPSRQNLLKLSCGALVTAGLPGRIRGEANAGPTPFPSHGCLAN